MKYFILSTFLFLGLLSNRASAQCMACETYSDALKQPSEVRMLQVRNTGEQPDDRIAECTKLQVLFWENSQISSLPSSLGKLQNLTDLSLANNQLKDVPRFIFQMKNLKVLNLQGNPMDNATKERLKREFAEHMPVTKVFL